MSKHKQKTRRKEKEHEFKQPVRDSAALKPQRPSVPLLVTSGSLLVLWLSYLFVVAMWGL